MNMKLYGICFKLRGGPDLLDYIQTGKPIPVDIMGQVMEQMGSVTQDELGFAEMIDGDWKKAMNERVPLLMNIAKDGSYDISCDVPDSFLETVKLLTGKEYEKIVEEYTATYLKDVCGVDAEIVSVDVDNSPYPEIMRTAPVKQEAPVKEAGFDLSALEEVPEGPAFEDLSDIDVEQEIMEPAGAEPVKAEPVKDEPVKAEPAQEPVIEEPVIEEPVAEEPAAEEPEDSYPEEYPEDYPEEYPDEYEGDYPEEGYEEEGMPEESAEEEGMQEEPKGEEEDPVKDAVRGIYKEMVTNIRDKKLDERLGLRIGQ